MEETKIYEELARRNGWDFGYQDNRPYFKENGNYAVPNETTSLEDKELLARIISEGSEEMQKLIIKCWDNKIYIGGPCSAIDEFHKEPSTLHFAFLGDHDLIYPLYESLEEIFPNIVFFRDCSAPSSSLPVECRYDISYRLKDRNFTKEESNNIFKIINQQLDIVLENQNKKAKK